MISNITRNKYGGEVIGAGGYGCVFKPALKCRNQKKRTTGISKLSTEYDSNKEWKELQFIEKYIKKIPNYKKYFLVSGWSQCEPAKLTRNDKVKLGLCNNIISRVGDVNIENINNHLHNFRIINMPYGGENLHNILFNNKISVSKINVILINLLVNGIIPMNKLNVYHLDLKADNMLYDKNLVRIIDFGEMSVSTSQQILPNSLFNMRIRFNDPFSMILFGSIFDNFLTNYLETNTINKDSELLFKELQLLALTFYTNFKIQYGEGHERLLTNGILLNIFRLNKSFMQDNFNLLDYLVSAYCAKVLMKYLDFDTKTFNGEKYFEEVFSKNVDVYGFIMSYVAIIMNNTIQDKTYKQQQIIVANIIIKYCLSDKYATVPIDVSDVINDLKQLSTSSQLKLLKSKTKTKGKSKGKSKGKTKSKSIKKK